MSNEWVMVPREPTRDMIDAAQNAPGNASYLYHARVYRAMLAAAPVPTAADCTSVCDAYAAENQQFSDELTRLRAEVERLTAVVKAANAQAEHFERQWYLRGDEVEALRADAETKRGLLREDGGKE